MGWTTAIFSTPEFDQLREEWNVWIELVWIRQHLLTTRRGYPFPRIALVLPQRTWKGESRHAVAKATRPIARELGMTKKGE